MSPILKRSLIFIVLMAAGLVLYMSWYNIKAERFNETAIPYLEQALPKLTSWQYPELEMLLSPTAKTVFASDKVRDVELIAYQVQLEFETGPAVIKLNLASDGQRYYIHHFGIHSHIFADHDDS